MKTPFWIGVVVALHVLVIGSVACFQGCGTTRVAPPPEPVMPPIVVSPPAPPRRPTPPPRPVDQPTDTVEYVVKSGDTLSGIAARYKVPVNQIVELNNISDPNRLRAGLKLIIPMRPGVTVHHPAPARPAAPAAAPSAGTEYIVKSGDTLSGIAVRFGTKVDDLRKLNKLEGDRILIGQKLIVAGAPEKQEPAPTIAPAPAAAATPSAQPADVADADEDATILDDLPPLTAGSEYDIIHVVLPNEDLAYIARLYVVPAEDIIKLNQLSDSKVQVGQKLKIP
ncbi:MAG: LysM peptidoglycan-binding domain-containing protein [Kiritimatiellia bacterium]